MKRVLLVLCLLLASTAQAQSTAADLMSICGMVDQCAEAVVSGISSTSDVDILASTDVTIGGGGTVDITVADNLITVAAGTVLTGGAGSWGWTVATGANTACTTTCGISACIIGNNTAGGATTWAPVACSDATADQCICAGPTS